MNFDYFISRPSENATLRVLSLGAGVQSTVVALLSVVRKSLLNAKAAHDDAMAIMGHAPHNTMPRADREPTIDTAAIYAQRNKKP